MESIEFQNCWRYWYCPKIRRENCPVFKANAGKDCWRFMASFARTPALKIKCRYTHCQECPWFKKFYSVSEPAYQNLFNK